MSPDQHALAKRDATLELPLRRIWEPTAEAITNYFQFLDPLQVQALLEARQQPNRYLPIESFGRLRQDTFLRTVLLSPQGTLSLTGYAGSHGERSRSYYVAARRESSSDVVLPLLQVLHADDEYDRLCDATPIELHLPRVPQGEHYERLLHLEDSIRAGIVTLDRNLVGKYVLQPGNKSVGLEEVIAAASVVSESDVVAILSSSRQYSVKGGLFSLARLSHQSYQDAVAKELSRHGVKVISLRYAPKTDISTAIWAEVPQEGDTFLEGVSFSRWVFGGNQGFTSKEVRRVLGRYPPELIASIDQRGTEYGVTVFLMDPFVTFVSTHMNTVESGGGGRGSTATSLAGHYNNPSISTQVGLLQLALTSKSDSFGDPNDRGGFAGPFAEFRDSAPLALYGTAMPEQPRGTTAELHGLKLLIQQLEESRDDSDRAVRATMINEHEFVFTGSQTPLPWQFLAYAMNHVANQLDTYVMLVRKPNQLVSERGQDGFARYSFGKSPRIYLDTKNHLPQDTKIGRVVANIVYR
ncbi:hypothetical protein HYS47_04850 [Candidatus Woesearchaeota archaeon]|nr:hypothetical protein [Candidatus Woesearchaeota archaeon]